MKPVDKKDMPKLYAVIGLGVLLVGYVLYSAMAPQGPAPDATKKDPAAGASPAAGGKSVAGAKPGGASPQETLGFDPNTFTAPQGGRDPFQPVGQITSPTAAPPPNKPVATVKLPPVTTTPPKRPQLPKSLTDLLGGKPASPVTTDANAGSVKPVPVEPEPPSLNVTGIVLGDPTSGNPRNVAILRSPSGDERRFVSVGDYVGNGFTVVAVHSDGVEIKDKAGNRRVTFKLGQSGEKTRASSK